MRRIRLKVFRRICWKHEILPKIKSATNALIIIYKNFSEQKNSRRNSNGQILLIAVLIVAVWLKPQMKIIELMLQTIFFKSTIIDVWRALIKPWPVLTHVITKLFPDGGPYHIGTCSANQWTGLYMIGTSVMKEFKVSQSMNR